MQANGGDLVAEALKANGVDVIYTLSGGHIFPIYDGCVKRDIRLVDVRHEQTAAFAAEAHGKLTGHIGVAVVTAGPGVTNAISAITTARYNGTPMLVLAGRAPQNRWGSGSLQEMDHIPLVSHITKHAATVFDASDCAAAVDSAIRRARTPHRGPVFLDFPMDTLFVSADGQVPQGTTNLLPGALPDQQDLERAADLLTAAERPVIVCGTDVWLGQAWDPLGELVVQRKIPVIVNGMGRGLFPPEHELLFSRARAAAFREADVVCVVGVPIDFRLNFGRFGDAKVIHIQDHPSVLSGHASPAVRVAGDLHASLSELKIAVGESDDRQDWVDHLRAIEEGRREAEHAELTDDRHPIHPARVYGVLLDKLAKDAIVAGDGGDFVSYAGKLMEVHEPGCWLDPGPFGCLGSGLGYAIAAKVVHPDRQVVLMAGDGALGFCASDIDTLVRHKLQVAIIVGNNGIWGLEKHPMNMIYGYDVAADLDQDTRYEDIAKAFGGDGERVEKAQELGDALDRAFASEVPYLVNVLTDPEVAYPRSANLA